MDPIFTSVWLWLFLLVIVWELVAVFRKKKGDTLSEHVWKLIRSPWTGLPIFALLGWVTFWHFPFGIGVPLGWQDGLAVLAGCLLWYASRRVATARLRRKGKA